MMPLSYIIKEMVIGAVSCLLVFAILTVTYAPIHHYNKE